MTLKLTKTVTNFLKERADQPFTARQIAQWIFESYPDECAEKKARSQSVKTDDDLVSQIVAEIGSQYPSLKKKIPQIKTSQGRPRKYYYTEKTDEDEISDVESISVNSEGVTELTEHSLYPTLSEYLWSQHGLYPLRVDEKRSSNKRGPGGNHWLYPDVVALENLTQDWHGEVQACVGANGDNKTRLWSFEVKLKLNSSNIRQSFFQTVSNSTWANYGYLVAAEISGDNNTLKELRILSDLHGIGLILLNTENPAESEIMIPAKARPNVDWSSCSRLAHENKDFLEYVRLIRQFYQTGDLRERDWDISGF